MSFTVGSLWRQIVGDIGGIRWKFHEFGESVVNDARLASICKHK